MFYKGRCYDTCPIRTYVFDHTGNSEELKNYEINLPKNLQDDDELQSIDRKKRSQNLYRTRNKLSEYYQHTADFAVKNTISCEPCDTSCLRCDGPLNSQCISCPVGSQLKRMANTNETYCINFSERSSGNAFSNLSNPGFNLNQFVIILVISIIIFALGLIFFVYCKRRCLPNVLRKQNDNEITTTYTYDRVALFADEDNQEDEIDYLNSLHPTVKIYTDDTENNKIIDNS